MDVITYLEDVRTIERKKKKNYKSIYKILSYLYLLWNLRQKYTYIKYLNKLFTKLNIKIINIYKSKTIFYYNIGISRYAKNLNTIGIKNSYLYYT